MSITDSTRRDFLSDSARITTAGWIALNLPWLGALASCAREQREFSRLTSAEAAAMRAFASHIIPADQYGPGADEAGAVYFVDRALGLPFFADAVPVVRAGLADLDRRARSAGAPNGFASLSHERQMTILRAIEHDSFFTAARTLVIIGTFADPAYGGNRNGAGWDLVKIEHRPSYQAPYGWYDARPNGEGKPPAAKRVA